MFPLHLNGFLKMLPPSERGSVRRVMSDRPQEVRRSEKCQPCQLRAFFLALLRNIGCRSPRFWTLTISGQIDMVRGLVFGRNRRARSGEADWSFGRGVTSSSFRCIQRSAIERQPQLQQCCPALLPWIGTAENLTQAQKNSPLTRL